MNNSARLRFEAKKHLPAYLSELGQLLGRAVSQDELLSLQETESVRERSKHVSRSPKWSAEIAFTQKVSYLRSLAQTLERRHSTPVHIWTRLSNICGLMRPVSFLEIDFGFSFDINDDGMISILGVDLKNELILDFSKNDRDEERLEVELSGGDWGVPP